MANHSKRDPELQFADEVIAEANGGIGGRILTALRKYPGRWLYQQWFEGELELAQNVVASVAKKLEKAGRIERRRVVVGGKSLMALRAKETSNETT